MEGHGLAARLLAGRPALRRVRRRMAACDEGLWEHSSRVAVLAAQVADRLGLDALRRDTVAIGALVHDFGKVIWPSVMRTSGPLGAVDQALIRAHPVVGVGLLRGFWPDVPPDVLVAVRQHHERWAGGGYPDGLVGDSVGSPARVVAAADALCAMREARPYRGRPLEPVEALGQLEADGHDPVVIDVLRGLVDQLVRGGVA